MVMLPRFLVSAWPVRRLTQLRVLQPMRHKLELYRTKSRGWGLRALEAIPSHVFVCAYAGMQACQP